MLPTRIFLALDFSPHAGHALDYAASLAAKTGASLLIAHVWAPLMITVPEAVIPATPAALQEAMDRIQVGLTDAAAKATKAGAPVVETALLQGDPWQEIVRAAHDRRCDLIVCGTHGRGAVAHFLLGSVAEKVVRKAECPVLVVRKPR